MNILWHYFLEKDLLNYFWECLRCPYDAKQVTWRRQLFNERDFFHLDNQIKSCRTYLYLFKNLTRYFNLIKSFCFIKSSIIKVPIFTIYKKKFFDESVVDFFRRYKLCWGIYLFLFSVVTSVGRRKVRKNMFMIPEHIVRKKLKYTSFIHEIF